MGWSSLLSLLAIILLISIPINAGQSDATPAIEIIYSSSEPTGANVMATFVSSENITITNNNGSPAYEFADNGQFTFEFLDAESNTGNATAEVSWIDRSPPALELISPANGNEYNSSDVPLEFTAADPNIYSCRYSLDSGADVMLYGCAGTTLSNLSDGSHSLLVSADDLLGQQSSVEISFSVNTSENAPDDSQIVLPPEGIDPVNISEIAPADAEPLPLPKFSVLSRIESSATILSAAGNEIEIEPEALAKIEANETVRVIAKSSRKIAVNLDSITDESAKPVQLKKLPFASRTAIFEISADSLGTLADLGFEKIYLDSQEMKASLSETVPLIGVDRVQNELNFTGEGIVVCLLDTGVDLSTPELDGKAISGYDFVNNDDDASDDSGINGFDGHGTQMAKIIHAIAPAADIVSVKVLGSDETGFSSDIISGIEFCEGLAVTQNVKVLSMSFGAGGFDSYCNADPVSDAANSAVESGILAVASTGNNGSNLITVPACAQNVVAVSASTKSDGIWASSNMNSLVDLLAPGENVIVGGQSLSGTSVSAAHVSGAAALLFQGNASLTPQEAEQRFKTTGRLIEFNGANYTRISAYNSVAGIFTGEPSNQTNEQSNETLPEGTQFYALTTAGPNSPSTLNNGSGGGGLARWSSPGNASANDTAYTSANLDGTEGSQSTVILNATNFSFSIPTWVSVTGISVGVKRYSSINGEVSDDSLKLIQNGALVGLTHASGTAWTNSEAYFTYGNSSDLWNATWTPADINSANFGVGLSAITTFAGAVTAYVNHVNISVHYTQCSNITTAGTTATLTENASVNGATCINVQAANVTIDCNGYSIIGNNASNTFGIYSNQTNTTVQNCIITNFTSAVYFNATNQNTITNTTGISSRTGSSQGNTFWLRAGNNSVLNNLTATSATNGVRIEDSSNNQISNISITLTAGSSAGLNLVKTWVSPNNNTVTSVTASSSSISGNALSFTTATNNTIRNSYFQTDFHSCNIASTSTGNLFENVTCNMTSAQYGILFCNGGSGCNNNIISGGTYQAAAASAIQFMSSSNNIVANATIIASGTGFSITGTGSNNTVYNNTFVGTTASPSTNFVVISGTGNGNTFYWNNFTNTSGAYVNDTSTGSGNFFNTSSAGIAQGNRWFNVINGSLDIVSSRASASWLSGYYYGDAGPNYPYNNSTSNKIFGNVVDYGPFTSTGTFCRNLSTTGSTLTLNGNATISGATCFNVFAANVTLDCAGYSITGNNTSGTYGVYSNSTNAAVKNCNAQNFTHAIFYNASSNGAVQNSTLATTQTNGYAVYFLASNNNTVANSTLTSGASSSLYIQNSNSSTIYNNTLISTPQTQNLLTILSPSSSNTFYWNNFTNTTGYHVNDSSSGTNYYNSSTEGNIWFDVQNGTVKIYGVSASSGFSSLYIGLFGSGYPYNNSTSSKVLGNVVDRYPLTPYPNTAPVIAARSVAPSSPNESTNITCNITVTDAEHSTTNISFEWYKNGSNQTALAGTYANLANNTATLISNVTPGNFSKGEKWSCNARAFDGYNYSSWTMSSNVTIQDAVPAVSTVSINSTLFSSVVPYTSDTMRGFCTGTDADLDSLSYHWTFYKNGAIFSSGSTASYSQGTEINVANITGSNVTSGSWILECKADDGVSNSSAVNSSTLTLNSCFNLNITGQSYALNENATISGSTCFNIFAANVTLDCAGYSITGNNTSGTYGVYSNSSNSTVKNCRIQNFTNAIYYVNSSSGAIYNNTLIPDSSNSNTLVLLTGTSANNTLYWNNFTNTSGLYLNDSSSTGANYLNTSSAGVAQGNIWADVINGSIDIVSSRASSTWLSGYYYGDAGPSYPYNNSTSNKIVGPQTDYGPFTSSGTFCRNLSTAGSTLTLNGNASINGSNCFNVTAANIVLNCNGYFVTGNNTTSTYGIYSTANNTTIRNCPVSNFMSAIWLFNSNGSTITNVTASSTNTGANPHGIYIQSGSNNFVNNSTATSTVGHGIIITSSNSNNITGSSGTSNSNSGFYITTSSSNIITNSTGTSTSGTGIYLTFAANSNTITGSNGTSTSGKGFYIVSSSSESITSATATSTSGDAFGIDSSSNSQIAAITATSSSGHGFSLSSSSNITLANSTSTSTSNSSVFLTSSSANNTISNVTIASTSSGRGLEIESSSSGNAIASNRISSNSTNALSIASSNNNRLYNNTFTSNSTVVLLLGSTNNSTFYWNNFTNTSAQYFADSSTGTNHLNTTVSGKAQGNYWFNVYSSQEVKVFDSDLDGWADSAPTSGYAYPLNSSNSLGKIAGSAADYGPAIVPYRLAFSMQALFNGTPTIYFANGTTANITSSSSSVYTPTIIITDSSGTVRANASMSGSSGSYYHAYALNGSNGWYNTTIYDGNVSFSFPVLFYGAQAWQGNFTDASGTAFTYRSALNITEPNAVQRDRQPIDVRFTMASTGGNNSVRIALLQNGSLVEIPHQLYNITTNSTTGKLTGANVVFIDTFLRNQTKNYYAYYSSFNKSATNYSTDLSVSNFSGNFTFANAHFMLNTTESKAATITGLQSKWSGMEFGATSTPQAGPEMVLSGSVPFNPLLYSCPASSLLQQNGTVFGKYNASGTCIIFSYALTYTFYSGTNYFLLETNVSTPALSSVPIAYKDTNLSLSKGRFNTLSYFNGSATTTQTLASSGAGSPYANLSNITQLSLTQSSLKNALGYLPYNDSSSASFTPLVTVADTANDYQLSRQFFNGTANTTTWFYSKAAYLLYDPANTSTLNNTYLALTNAMTSSLGSDENISAVPPTYNSTGITPSTANDTANVTCYSYWQSSQGVLLQSATIIFNSSNYSASSTQTLSGNSSWVNLTVNSTVLEAGAASCNITVTDEVGGSNSTLISFTVNDLTAPIVTSLTTSPNATADLDPSVQVTVTANITEFSNASNVTAILQYNSTSNATLTNVTMTRTSNGTYWAVFAANFTPSDEANYTYRVNATDTANNSNATSFSNLSVLYDWTWTNSPSTFGTISANTGSNATITTLTLNNTGDRALSFTITSNFHDSNKIYYNGTAEGSSGYAVNLAANASTNFTIVGTGRTVARSDTVTITIDALNSSSSPSAANLTGTFVSCATGTVCLAVSLSAPTSVTQGDTGVQLNGTISNVGDQNSNGTSITWTLPSGWTITSGSASESLGTLLALESASRNLTVSIGASATTGSQTVTLNATNSAGDNASASSTVVVSSSSTSTTNNTTTTTTTTGGTTGGSGGGGGGGGAAGGVAPISAPTKKVEKPLTKEQQSALFSTLSSYELVRGRDSTFLLNITNPLDYDMSNVSVSASGYLYQYLKLDPSNLPVIPAGKSKLVRITLTAPKYFTEGTFTLEFDISGTSVSQTETSIITTNVQETRNVELKVLEMSREDAYSLMKQAYRIRNEMKQSDVFHGSVARVFEDMDSAYKEDRFSTLSPSLSRMRDLRSAAFGAQERLALLKEKIDRAESEEIKTPQTARLYSIASAAFERGDYSNAMLRLGDAELTYALETAQGFSLYSFFKRYTPQIIAGFVLLSLVAVIVFVDLRLWMMDNELAQLTNEEEIVLGLLREVQTEYFEKGKLSTEEYYTTTEQYEGRLGKIIQRKVELETAKKNYFTFKTRSEKLESEKSRLEQLIAELQGAYLEKGKVETRVYENRMKSYISRLSEVEETIAVSEARENIKKEKGVFGTLKAIFAAEPPSGQEPEMKS